jgi:hypothetical protein
MCGIAGFVSIPGLSGSSAIRLFGDEFALHARHWLLGRRWANIVIEAMMGCV